MVAGDSGRSQKTCLLYQLTRIVDDGQQKNIALSLPPFEINLATMNTTFTAILKKDGPWWIGWIEEVSGVNAQEETKEKLLSSLREILSEALEFNRAEARQAAENNYTEELVTV